MTEQVNQIGKTQQGSGGDFCQIATVVSLSTGMTVKQLTKIIGKRGDDRENAANAVTEE